MAKKMINFSIILLILVSFTVVQNKVEAQSPILVGAPICLTGTYASDGQSYLMGVVVAVDEINKTGGLLGRPLKIEKFDTENLAPEKVMQAADSLAQKGVDCFMPGWGGWGQDVKAYGKYDMPMFHVDASASSLAVWREDPEKYSNVFSMFAGESEYGEVVFETMMKLPYSYPNKKVAVISGDDDWARAIANSYRALAKKNNWELVVDEVVPYGTREWKPILVKIRSTNPSLIMFDMYSPPEAMTFFEQFMEKPINAIINYSYSLSVKGFVDNMGDKANGLLGWHSGLPGPKAPTLEAEAWLKRVKDEYGVESAGSEFPVYTGVMMWANAVKAIGDPKNYKAINKYIKENTFRDHAGRNLKFNEENYIPSSIIPLSHNQVQNGRLITIFTRPGEKYLDYKFQVPPWIKQ